MNKTTGNRAYWLPVVLFLLLFAQVTYTGVETSLTIDEPLHIISGYASLTTGDFRLVEEHPPLLKMLQAIPLLWLDPPLPDITTVQGWEDSDLIEVARNTVIAYRPIDRLVFAARVPTMLLSLLTAAFVYRWAKDVLGNRGALLALALFVFDPNILAHSAVAATDLSAAWGIFASSYMFWRWIRRSKPRWRDAISVGIVLGLALGLKLTVMILGPVFALFVLFSTRDKRLWIRNMFQAITIVGVAFLVLWASYGFEFGPIPELTFPVPMPSHAIPVRRLLSHIDIGHPAFLLGENYETGDWRYFPVAFAIKTPLLTLGLLSLSILGSTVTRFRRNHEKLFLFRYTYLLLSSVPLLYFAMSITSAINIGYRHLLPILPFVFVLCADALDALIVRLLATDWPKWVSKSIPLLILGLYCVNTLRIEPWQLAYFNPLIGGVQNGYRYLVDSNLDWGQAWKALAQYQRENDIDKLYFSAWSFNDPEAYGIEYIPLTPWPQAQTMLADRFEPSPGVYAISGTQLQGVVVALPDMYDYFRHLEPIARPGLAIHVYDIPDTPPADWIAQCNVPVPALTEDMILEGFRSVQAKRLYFDCTQTWLIAPGRGFTVIPEMSESIIPDIESGDEMRLAFTQNYNGWAPAFSIYERTASMPLPEPQVGVDDHDVVAKDTLRFRGYAITDKGSTVVIYTYWSVITLPGTPISLMAHLRDEAGNTIGVADGLGASNSELIPGSLLIQKHEYPAEVTSTGQPLHLWVGAYTWPDLVRYPVTVDGQDVGDAYDAGAISLK